MGDWLFTLPMDDHSRFCGDVSRSCVRLPDRIGLAVDDRARAFKAVSPGMLPPLGIIFGLLVGFVAVPGMIGAAAVWLVDEFVRSRRHR
jgi:hypothetical protein